MSTISLCMIVKNEENVLSRCLDSIKELIDEIIIVDTGSTDNTKSIAKKYTDKIYDFQWIDDFSAARNFSFSKSTMEYSMWMDADDVFNYKYKNEFLDLKKAGFNSADIIMMPYITSFDEDGNPVFSYYRERIIKSSIDFSWKGKVHEVISHSSNNYLYSEISIIHKSVKETYTDRNLKIYEKQISDGDDLSPRDMFYYGRELFYHQKYNESIICLTRFLNMPGGWIENKIEACKFLSYSHNKLDNKNSALTDLFLTFSYDTPRAEICCEIGALFMQLQNFKAAIFWYKLALKIPLNEKSGAFISKDCYGYIPYIQLCVCYDKIGEHNKAMEYNALAGKIRPNSPSYITNLQYFESLNNK